VEDKVLSTLNDVVVFRQVETVQAMLTVSVVVDTAVVGTSVSYDIITALGLASSDENFGPDKVLPPTSSSQEQQLSVTIPVDGNEVSVSLVLSHEPSKSFLRADLFDRLNRSVQKRAAAVTELRQLASSQARGGSGGGGTVIPAGFLNKNGPSSADGDDQDTDTLWKRLNVFYEQYLGPQSMIQVVTPVVKNYVIFFVAVGWMHYRGQALGLPKPV
jgi:hypothetical protein